MHIDITEYLPNAEVLFNQGPVALVFTGGECYAELIVQDFVDGKTVATHVFDHHDADTLRELAAALNNWADGLDEVNTMIEEL